MTGTLEPLEPEEAVDLYLAQRSDNASERTVQAHRYRLKLNTLLPSRCRPAKACDGEDSCAGKTGKHCVYLPSERSEAERRRTAVAQRRRQENRPIRLIPNENRIHILPCECFCSVMTIDTKRHQVPLIVCTSGHNRNYVMNIKVFRCATDLAL